MHDIFIMIAFMAKMKRMLVIFYFYLLDRKSFNKTFYLFFNSD